MTGQSFKVLLAALVFACALVSKPQGMSSITLAQNDSENLSYNGSPAWSPDGKLLAFVSGQAGNLDIWVMESDGSHPQNLTEDDPGPNFSPLWAPDGQLIAYISAPVGADFYDLLSGTAFYDVWVIEHDGSHPVNLTADFEGYSGEYRWSPDGNHIALISNIPLTSDGSSEVNTDIWLMEPDGSHPVNLTSESDILPGSLTWGPDSRLIAFTSATVDPVQRDGIRLLQIDDPDLSVVTSKRSDVQVAWSPGGDVLAVTTLLSDGSGLYDIWRVDVNGQNLINLTPNSPGLDWNPVWSPDGQSLAFESSRDIPDGQGRDVWVMSADGSNAVNLTGELFDWSIRPSWSPDGTRIAFEAYEDNDFTAIGISGRSDIWIINADGSNPTKLTSDNS